MLLLWGVTSPLLTTWGCPWCSVVPGRAHRGAGLLQRALWCWRKQQAGMDCGMRPPAHPVWAQLGFPVLLHPLAGW